MENVIRNGFSELSVEQIDGLMDIEGGVRLVPIIPFPIIALWKRLKQ